MPKPEVEFHTDEQFPIKIRRKVISPPFIKPFIETYLLLTVKQRNNLLRQVKNRQYHWTTACCTSVFQQNLIPAYKHVLAELKQKPDNVRLKNIKKLLDGVHSLSTLFIDFERYINNPLYGLSEDAELSECLKNLEGLLTSFLEKLNNKLESLSFNEKCDNRIKALKVQIKDRVDAFQKRIDSLKAKEPPDFNEIKEIFKMHSNGFYGDTLGSLSAYCMKDILKMGRDIDYELSDSPIYDSFFVSKTVEAFSDADAQITKKMFSLSGTEHVINDPIPPEVIDSLTVADEDLVSPDKQGWYPASEYLSTLDNVEEMDEIIYISYNGDSYNLSSKRLYPILTSVAIYTASLFEFPFVATGFLLSQIVLTPFSLAEQFFFKNSEHYWSTNFSQRITNFFHFYSPVRKIKKAARERYLENTENNVYTKEIRDSLTEQPNSFFISLWEKYSSDKTASFILRPRKQRFYIPLWEDFQHILGIHYYKETPEAVYQRVSRGARIIREKTEIAFNFLKREKEKLLENEETKESSDSLDSINIEDIEEEFSSQMACKTPGVKSPLRIPKLLLEHIFDNSLDEALRKSPALTTLEIILSGISGGSFFLTGLPAALNSILAVLQHVPDKLGVLVSNQAHHIIAERVLGNFIELVIGAEGAKFLRNFDPRKSTSFSHHEETVMALYLTAVLGVAMQAIPMLPKHIHILRHTFNDPYTDVLDFLIQDFVNETTPVGAFEIATTGLAIGLKACSILLTKHHVPKTEIQAFIRKLNERNVFVETDSQKAFDDFKEVLETTLFSETIKEELQTGFNDGVFTSRQSTITKFASERNSLIRSNSAAIEELLEEENRVTCAYKALKDALEMLNYVSFDTTADALKFFNHLHHLFSQYNEALTKMGRKEAFIDPQPILNDFYNLHCYKGSFVPFRLFYLVPFTVPFPIVPLWRLIKWTVGAISNDPALVHQVNKSINKEILMLGQCFSAVNRLILVTLRAITYLTRISVGLALAIPAVVLDMRSIYKEGLWKRVKAYGSFLNTNIAFHRTTSWVTEKIFWEPVRSLFKQATTIASINNNLSVTIKLTLRILGDKPPKQKQIISPELITLSQHHSAQTNGTSAGNLTFNMFKRFMLRIKTPKSNDLANQSLIVGAEAAPNSRAATTITSSSFMNHST